MEKDSCGNPSAGLYPSAMKLQEYLDTNGLRAYKFADEHGLNSATVYNHLNGFPVQYQTAKRISEATAGAVSVLEIMEL